MIIKFYKEQSNRWFAYLPSYPGAKDDLEMVDGADILLYKLSNGKSSVDIEFSELPFANAFMMNILETMEGVGSYYYCADLEIKLYLCEVTKFVFGYYPAVIYFKNIIENEN